MRWENDRKLQRNDFCGYINFGENIDTSPFVVYNLAIILEGRADCLKDPLFSLCFMKPQEKKRKLRQKADNKGVDNIHGRKEGCTDV